jgi:hypothetical protein
VGNGEPSGAAVWSPDGHTIFISGEAGPLLAYLIGDRQAVSLGIPGSSAFTVW